MKSSVNYYKVLGVVSTATEDEITRAFRKRILQVHHDKNIGESNNDLCYETLEAYRVLSNRQSRMKYDVQRDNEKRILSDNELLKRYRATLSINQQNELQVTSELLQTLRENYNRLRNEDFEKFTPAGVICYDVENLLSQKFKSDIRKWQTEFKGHCLHDNYFSFYERVIDGVLETPTSTLKFWCELCSQKFISESYHWETILVPYVKYMGISNTQSQDVEREKYLFEFLSKKIGVLFTWEPKTFTSSLSIWSYEEWGNLRNICANVAEFVTELPNPDHFERTEDHVTYIQKCTWADDVTVALTCWVLVYNDMESLVQKASDLFLEEALEDLLVYVAVLKEFLGFDKYDWGNLRQDALKMEEVEMAMLWTMVMVQLKLETPRDEWITLGMEPIVQNSNLAHFCFLLAIEAEDEAVDDVVNNFLKLGEHLEAMSYLIHFESMSSVLEKYVQFRDTDYNVANLYRTVYYSQKIKNILSRLHNVRIEEECEESDIGNELEELVEIIQVLFEDPSDAFRLILQLYVERFTQPEFYSIHGRTIENLQSGSMTSATLKLVLAAWHFVGNNEIDEEFLNAQSQELIKIELAENLKIFDFESLTETLLELNSRNVSGAENIWKSLIEDESMSNHLKAMKLMIGGTIQKVYKCWIDATSAYQEALLNTPEINYRLTPCISKLSQDIELHEAIVNEVQEKLNQLKTSFTSYSYVHISNDKVSDSLVISHPTPQHEYGYSALAPKIQTEPPKSPQVDDFVEDSTFTPLQPANTPEVTLEKCERAIEVGEEKPLSPLDAALAYVDLLSSLPPSMRHGPTVMAASHFLKAIQETREMSVAYAFKKAIVELAQNLLELDKSSQAKVQSCLTHKHMFSILLMANQSLSNWRQNSNFETSDETCAKFEDKNVIMSDAESIDLKNLSVGNEKWKSDTIELISSEDEHVIKKLLKNIVGFSKVEPLLNIPTLCCSDLGYVERVKTHFLHQFCSDKISKRMSQVAPTQVHAQTLLLEVIYGRNQAVNFETAKMYALEVLLSENNWNIGSMTRFIDWPLVIPNHDGWNEDTRTLNFHSHLKTFESIEGFKINKITGEISFLLKKGNDVFSHEDLFEIFQNGISKTSLKQCIPESDFYPHPSKTIKYEPMQLAGTEYLKTLIQVSRLLTTFATGMEVNSNPPFLTRETEIGLLHFIPEYIQYFLRPIRERSTKIKTKHENDFPYFFSLSLTQCYYEESEELDNEYVFTLGDVEPEVSCADENLEFSLDKNHNEALFLSKSFAADFTKNFNEIGKYFPEFLRLKQLFKISLICSKLNEILKETENKIGITQFFNKKIQNRIRSLGIGGTTDESQTDEFECSWIPSPSCHSHPGVIDVVSEVNIAPILIYGPVSSSSKSYFLTVEELLTPVQDFSEHFEKIQEDDVIYEVSTTVTVNLNRRTQICEEYTDDVNVVMSCHKKDNLHESEDSNEPELPISPLIFVTPKELVESEDDSAEEQNVNVDVESQDELPSSDEEKQSMPKGKVDTSQVHFKNSSTKECLDGTTSSDSEDEEKLNIRNIYLVDKVHESNLQRNSGNNSSSNNSTPTTSETESENEDVKTKLEEVKAKTFVTSTQVHKSNLKCDLINDSSRDASSITSSDAEFESENEDVEDDVEEVEKVRTTTCMVIDHVHNSNSPKDSISNSSGDTSSASSGSESESENEDVVEEVKEVRTKASMEYVKVHESNFKNESIQNFTNELTSSSSENDSESEEVDSDNECEEGDTGALTIKQETAPRLFKKTLLKSDLIKSSSCGITSPTTTSSDDESESENENIEAEIKKVAKFKAKVQVHESIFKKNLIKKSLDEVLSDISEGESELQKVDVQDEIKKVQKTKDNNYVVLDQVQESNFKSEVTKKHLDKGTSSSSIEVESKSKDDVDGGNNSVHINASSNRVHECNFKNGSTGKPIEDSTSTSSDDESDSEEIEVDTENSEVGLKKDVTYDQVHDSNLKSEVQRNEESENTFNDCEEDEDSSSIHSSSTHHKNIDNCSEDEESAEEDDLSAEEEEEEEAGDDDTSTSSSN